MPQLIQFVDINTGEPVLIRSQEILAIASFKGGNYTKFTMANGAEFIAESPYSRFLDALKATASLVTVLPVRPA